jgi:hypothetical protein
VRVKANKSNTIVEEGCKVEANYRGKGKWYPGKISRERADGTFDIAYDDGESESRVSKENIRIVGVDNQSTSSFNNGEGLSVEVYRVLLEHGADPDKADKVFLQYHYRTDD